jgi:hypothetical protein
MEAINVFILKTDKNGHFENPGVNINIILK